MNAAMAERRRKEGISLMEVQPFPNNVAPHRVMESMMFLNKANPTRESLINIRLHHFPNSLFAFSFSHLRSPEFNPPHLQGFVFIFFR